MASSAVEICNIALGRIGQGQFIADLNASSAEAKACNAFYANARDATLEAFPWQFATGRATLAELDIDNSEWLHVYALPADCLVPRYIPNGTGDRHPATEAQVEFALEHDTVGGQVVLCTDMDVETQTVELVYTRKMPDVRLYPALFIDALAYKLASDLALRIPVKPQVGQAMELKYRQALALAGAKDFTKAQGTRKPPASYIRARGGRTGV